MGKFAYLAEPVKDNGARLKLLTGDIKDLYTSTDIKDLYTSTVDALKSFYAKKEFYQTAIHLKIPPLIDFQTLPQGQSRLKSLELELRREESKPLKLGYIDVNYFKGTRDKPKKGVDYPASSTFAKETITTYEALTLWFNTIQPPLPNDPDIKDNNKTETTVRRSLERDAFLAFLKQQ